MHMYYERLIKFLFEIAQPHMSSHEMSAYEVMRKSATLMRDEYNKGASTRSRKRSAELGELNRQILALEKSNKDKDEQINRLQVTINGLLVLEAQRKAFDAMVTDWESKNHE